MDFLVGALAYGTRFRILTVVDTYSRECSAIRADRNIKAPAVTSVLDRVIRRRGRPATITVDNGSEFTSNHLDLWAYTHGAHLDFIRPRRPVENAMTESFNGRVRDECLNASWHDSFDDARRTIEDWRHDYNDVKPRSRLGVLTPSGFAARYRGRGQETASRKAAVAG
jgi:putative transposase